MRKLFVVSLFLGLMVSIGFAFQPATLPLGVGAKYAAMGGAGASMVDDLTSAYYNPAGICGAGNFELKIGAGAATEGINELIGTFGSVTDPSKFLSENYAKSINVSGGFNSIVGLNVAKVGISVIPVAFLSLTKPANSLGGITMGGSANYEGILTLGYGFSIPGLPIAGIDLGVNIKSVNIISASSITNATGTTGTDTVTTLSGVGFDLGAKANINTPLVPISAGIVMKDISETIKGKRKTVTTTYDPLTGAIINQTSTETDSGDITNPTTLAIGVSTVIPGVGLKVAVDFDSVSGSGTSYSVTHLGIEYPILGIVALRAGTVSGGPSGNISQTTLGLGLNLGININAAMMTDAKNSKNNSTIIDFGFAF